MPEIDINTRHPTGMWEVRCKKGSQIDWKRIWQKAMEKMKADPSKFTDADRSEIYSAAQIAGLPLPIYEQIGRDLHIYRKYDAYAMWVNPDGGFLSFAKPEDKPKVEHFLFAVGQYLKVIPLEAEMSSPKRVFINPAELLKIGKTAGNPIIPVEFERRKMPLLKPKSPLPFPRAPSREEQDIFWEHFTEAVFEMGKDPARFREAFDNRMKLPYRSWEAFLTVYEQLLKTIEAGKEVAIEYAIPLLATRIAMPWRTDIAENERFDAIVHLTSIRLYPTIEDLIYSESPPGLEAYGILGVTPEEVKETVKKAWKEKNPWLRLIDKEWLEKFIEEKLD